MYSDSDEKARADFKVYIHGLKKDIAELTQMVNNLKAGIVKEEFVLFFQPIFNLFTNEITGVEALVRWFHPDKGYISPDEFIPVAEQSELIYDLEHFIVRKALQQKMEWEREGLDKVELSINLSGKTLESEDNFNKIEKLISSFPVDYFKLIIELTETAFITNLELAMERLKRLKSFGIKIAMDDFGTGYSSLMHLINLPIDIIKIDRSFIRALQKKNKETVVTKNILTMAHDLDYKVIAEGIETQEQLDYLKINSCESGQGFLLCIPLTSEKVSELLRMKIC